MHTLFVLFSLLCSEAYALPWGNVHFVNSSPNSLKYVPALCS